jgi:nucleotide-binding universal stress UspA family protein
VAAAERLDVDLVALGSHERSGFGRALLGSVAEEVARRSLRPVIIVRARPRETHR